MTMLQFPIAAAVGEVWWEDVREPRGWSHLLAVGVVDVPDGAAVRLTVNLVAKVETPADDLQGVTWQRGTPDSALSNDIGAWGDPRETSSIKSSHAAVDLEFIRRLPEDSVYEFNVRGDVVPDSFAAVAHLAPGLRHLSVILDDLSPNAPSVIAQLTALEMLVLVGGQADEDSFGRLDDHALSMIADLPTLESLTLLDGVYTEHGLQQLGRLRNLRHLHIEREGLTASMFQFAVTMPSLTRLSGLDEFLDDGPMPPSEVAQLRVMLPHVIVG